MLNGKSLIARDISSKGSLFNKPIVHFFLIAIVGFLVYSNTFNIPFHFDDAPNIVENYRLRDLNNFWPPSSSRWFGFLTFALNYYFGGLNVAGYHIVNIAIHILNAILVYWIVSLTLKIHDTRYKMQDREEILQDTASGTHSTFNPLIYLSLFIALIFVSHPIQTQAVTYIVQRFTSLATMFYLFSLVMYIKARLSQPAEAEVKAKFFSTSTLTFYFLSIVSAILAVKTKEIAFTLPIIIVLYELMFFEGNIKKRMLYLIPMLLTMLIIPLSLIGIDKPIGDAIGELREASQETEQISRDVYLLTQFRVIVTYIRLLLLPINQNLDYDYPIYHSIINTGVFLSLCFLLSLFGFGIYLFRRSNRSGSEMHSLSQRVISFGIFWFFITLSIESSIIPIADVIFEHRLYLPSVGAIIAFVSAVFYYASLVSARSPEKFRFISGNILRTLIVIVAVLSVLTYQRNTIWQNKEKLWGDVVKKSPAKARPHLNYGLSYNEDNVDKAMEEYKLAAKLDPTYPEAHNNLGYVLQKKGAFADALHEYQTALQLRPNYPYAYNNLGSLFEMQGHLDEALEAYGKALSLKPDYPETYSNRGNIYQRHRLPDQAISEYKKALEIDPQLAEAYYNLGNSYLSKGLFNESIMNFRSAIEIKPGYVKARNNLGVAYQKKGLLDEAIGEFESALGFNPNFSEARANLEKANQEKSVSGRLGRNDMYARWAGVLPPSPSSADEYYRRATLLSEKGYADKAITDYQKAIDLNPKFAEAYNDLGVVYMGRGLLKDALDAFQRAAGLKQNFFEAHTNMGKIYSMKGSYDKAIQEYQTAIRINPQLAEAYNGLGVAFSNKGVLDDALKAFQNGVRLRPVSSEYRANLGLTYGKKGLLDEAIKEFQVALKLDPMNLNAHTSLGTAYAKKGLVADAVKAYRAVLQLDPNNAVALDNLNKILQMNKTK